MVETTDIEKKSLEAHVELCAERYKSLESQFTDVKGDMNELKGMLQKTHTLVHDISEKRNSQLINWGVSIIAALTATVAWLVTHYTIT
jgi:uncharacterized protein YoxC